MTDQQERPAGLRERTRRAVQAEIVAAAMRLFLERGFEATSMDQIATEVGMSRRSLFRYFGTKEDIVLGDHAAHGQVLRAALEERPADEPPWQALRAALVALLRSLPYDSEDFLKITGMLHASPPSGRAGERSSSNGRNYWCRTSPHGSGTPTTPGSGCARTRWSPAP